MTEAPANTIEFLLGTLNAKLDIVLSKSSNHEDRIVALEKWRIWIMALATAGGFAAGKIPLPF